VFYGKANNYNRQVAKPRVPLSPAVKIGNLLFVSGSRPFDIKKLPEGLYRANASSDEEP
jgi:enamine deaminase RidA (YjgF/YER057c/UK114 family)